MRVAGRRWRVVAAAGFVILLTVLTAQNISARARPPAFFRPAALKNEAKLLLHFFVFSKWINRYFETHGTCPPDVAVAAREQREEGRLADNAVDPWGTAYRVTFFPDGFAACSAGPDKVFATADDRKFRSYRPPAPDQPAGATLPRP